MESKKSLSVLGVVLGVLCESYEIINDYDSGKMIVRYRKSITDMAGKMTILSYVEFTPVIKATIICLSSGEFSRVEIVIDKPNKLRLEIDLPHQVLDGYDWIKRSGESGYYMSFLSTEEARICFEKLSKMFDDSTNPLYSNEYVKHMKVIQ